MSYRTWSIDGFGFCVDNIETTMERALKLAALNEEIYEDLKDYINDIREEAGFTEEDGYTDEDITIDFIDEFEGNYGERGLTTILREVISQELPVAFADDFDGTDFILYCPSYPWGLNANEKNLTKQDVINIFNKYLSILTDEPIAIDYYSVENGG